MRRNEGLGAVSRPSGVLAGAGPLGAWDGWGDQSVAGRPGGDETDRLGVGDHADLLV